MPTRVRSHAKINLGLAIGPPRPDGYHALSTLYQTLALHDHVIVAAERAAHTRIHLRSNDPRVPTDGRNTVWKMVERVLAHLGLHAEVTVDIRKSLPIQGGLGAGSANAAAALLGLERELRLVIAPERRLRIAAEVGSDVPLFLVGGTVLGSDRGEQVTPAPALTLGGSAEIACVIALPGIGVSTPQAFRDWDRRFEGDTGLHNPPVRDTLNELNRTFASVLRIQSHAEAERNVDDTATAGLSAGNISGDPSQPGSATKLNHPEKLQDSREQHHTRPPLPPLTGGDRSGGSGEDDLAGNSLSALLRTGMMENDFETVVFPQYPRLLEIKGLLEGLPEEEGCAIYAALSGSGSALFGLFRSQTAADQAQQRLQRHGVSAIVTKTVSRPRYWSEMFAE